MSADQNPVFSLIVVTWNSWEDLDRCLSSIYNSDLDKPLEVIVIDNASVDSSCAKINEKYPQVNLQRNTINVGHTKGVNQGFRIAQGQYLVLLDVDTEFSSDMLGGMLEFLKSRPDVSLATPRNLNSDGSIQESSRNLPGIMSGIFGRQSKLTEMFPNNPFTKRYLARSFLDETEPFQVEQISAACMIFPRTLLDEIGLWDERYPGYWVDTDWCAHIKSKGKKTFCVPGYEITHHENNAKGKRKSIRRIWLFHYGAYLLYTKWYSWGVLDPRSLLAGGLLTARAVLQWVGNYRMPAAEDNPDFIKHNSSQKP